MPEEIEVDVPAGMRRVTHDEFWAAVAAEKRNIHPTPNRLTTDWLLVDSRQPWGWMSTGYASPHGARRVYGLA